MSATVASSPAISWAAVDERAQPVFPGAERDASGDAAVCVDRPRRRAPEGHDGASLVAGGFEGDGCLGQLQLVDADYRTQFRPRDLSVAGHEGEQEVSVVPLHDQSLDHARGRQVHESGRLVEGARRGTFEKLDLDTARVGVGLHAVAPVHCCPASLRRSAWIVSR